MFTLVDNNRKNIFWDVTKTPLEANVVCNTKIATLLSKIN